jgi:hypothetical protein
MAGIIRRQYRNDVIAVGTTAVAVRPQLIQEGDCEVLALKNTSTGGQKITIAQGLGRVAVSGSGIVLAPSESWTETHGDAFSVGHEPISAVSDGAGGTLAIYERIRFQR